MTMLLLNKLTRAAAINLAENRPNWSVLNAHPLKKRWGAGGWAPGGDGANPPGMTGLKCLYHVSEFCFKLFVEFLE